MGTKNNPGAFDCYANAAPDEPMFVLLGRDPIGWSLVALWCLARMGLGKARDDEKIVEADACKWSMLKWCSEQAGREPRDVLQLLPVDVLANELRRRGMYVAAERHADVDDMRARKDAAYLERNRVVAALASAFPSGIARTAIEGWSEDWHGCVYIDLPTGQASWHYHDSHAHLFEHLPAYPEAWDGHTTEEKYERLAALANLPTQPDVISTAVRRGELLRELIALAEVGDADLDPGWHALLEDARAEVGDPPAPTGEFEVGDRLQLINEGVCRVVAEFPAADSTALYVVRMEEDGRYEIVDESVLDQLWPSQVQKEAVPA